MMIVLLVLVVVAFDCYANIVLVAQSLAKLHSTNYQYSKNSTVCQPYHEVCPTTSGRTNYLKIEKKWLHSFLSSFRLLILIRP